MQVITVGAPKGGSGKTTVATLLAVRAMHDAKNVALIDLNPDQGNLELWWRIRGSPLCPMLVQDITSIVRDVERLRHDGRFDVAIIDTPPAPMDVIESAVIAGDCVIVPVRSSLFDLGTTGAIVEMCKAHRKPFSFLRSAVDSKFAKLNQSALAALVMEGPVFATEISYRLPYINALTAGKTGPEIEKSLQGETNTLWHEVQALMASAPKFARRAAND